MEAKWLTRDVSPKLFLREVNGCCICDGAIFCGLCGEGCGDGGYAGKDHGCYEGRRFPSS